MKSSELKPGDQIRVIALPSWPRPVTPGFERYRHPKVGDLATVVCRDQVGSHEVLLVEGCDSGGKTLWLAHFEPNDVELVAAV